MERKYFVGIDFGHGETTVSRVPGYNGQKVSQIPLTTGRTTDEKKLISAICRHNNEWSLVFSGKDYNNDDLHEGFKGMIHQLSDEDKEALCTFAQLIFKRILDMDTDLIYRSPSERNFELGIACPTEWSSVEVRGYKNAKEQYLDFFRTECNIPVDLCINESDAAFFTKYDNYNQTDSVFVIDLGSSTIDFTTFVNSKVNKKLCWGANLGAHKIEDIIIDHLKQSGDNMANLQRVIKMRQEANYRGNIEPALLLFIRKAKENYYINEEDVRDGYMCVNIFTRELFPGYRSGDFCVTWSIDAAGYDNAISWYSQALNNEIMKAKQRLALNGITPTRVLLSGGACKMSFFEQCVRTQFADSIIDKDNEPECVVAHGVALYAKKLNEALKVFLDELKKIDYEYIFKRANADAESAAIKELVPSVVDRIISGQTRGNDNGKFIRREFLDFIEKLDHNNYRYCQLVKNAINEKLSEKVASAISIAIKEVFKISRSTPNIKIETNPVIYHYLPECFAPGGLWYKQITTWIEEASSTILAALFFNWDEHIYSSERTKIANGVASSLKQYDSFGKSNFLNLDRSIKDLVNQVMDLAKDVFYEQQLFETTFKQ